MYGGDPGGRDVRNNESKRTKRPIQELTRKFVNKKIKVFQNTMLDKISYKMTITDGLRMIWTIKYLDNKIKYLRKRCEMI